MLRAMARSRRGPVPVRASLQQLLQASYGSAQTRLLAVSQEHQRRRMTAYDEFSTWYALNIPQLGVTRLPWQALPEEIMVYYQQHWLQCHGDTYLQGRCWAAPTTLENNCSLLSVHFEHAGRTGPYSSETSTGNPMKGRDMQEFKEGYSRLLRNLGYAVTSAKHLDATKYDQAIVQTDAMQLKRRATLDWSNRTDAMQFLLVERDLLQLCGAWTTGLRGHDLGRLHFNCIQHITGISLITDLFNPDYVLSPGMPYQVAPDGTKTNQSTRAGVINGELLCVKEDSKAQLCFLRRLRRYLHDCHTAGVSTSCFIFRPLSSHGRDFEDKPADSSSLNKRYQHLLSSVSLHDGETLHGVRRGTLLADHRNGVSLADIGARALQVTPAVTRQYLDTSRETYGPVRQRGGRHRRTRYAP